MPRISVLVTYHNEGEKLTRCLDSIVRQRPPIDEILVHDDASSLRPEPYLPDDPRIRVLRSEPNVGPAVGRNRLLAASSGDYVHWHDADDWLEPGWAEAMQAQLRDAPELVYCEVRAVDEQGVEVAGRVLDVPTLKSEQQPLAYALRNSLLVPSSLIARTLLQRVGGYREDLRQSEDYEFNLRLLGAEPRLALVETPLVTLEWRKDNRSRVEVGRVYQDAFAILGGVVAAQPGYKRLAAEAVAGFVVRLLDKGELEVAREGVRLTRAWGPPDFRHFGRAYRLLARWFGQIGAWRLTRTYQRLVPRQLRAWLRLGARR